MSSTVSVGSDGSFSDVAFRLPELESGVEGGLTEEEEIQLKLASTQTRLVQEIRKERMLLSCLDNKTKYSPGKSAYQKNNSSMLQSKQVSKDSRNELAVLSHIITRKPGEPKEVLRTLTIAALVEDDFSANSSSSCPQIGSIHEKKEDLREEEIERWCAKHGKKSTAKYTNDEKRKLRTWFQELDYDGSGEVNVEELQDPLLSAGILKTKEQVVRVLANVDKNNTMGIDFEEFLLALNDNKIADGMTAATCIYNILYIPYIPYRKM